MGRKLQIHIVAKRLGVSRPTVRRWIIDGDLPAERHEGGSLLVDEDELAKAQAKWTANAIARRPPDHQLHDVVYFVQSTRGGPIKIGFAGTLNDRVQNLQSAHAYPLDVLLAIPGDLDLEHQFHEQFAKSRDRKSVV